MQSPGLGLSWTTSRWATGEGRPAFGENSTVMVFKVAANTSISSITWNLLGIQILRPSLGLLNQNLGVGPAPTLQGCHCTQESENTEGECELGKFPCDHACTCVQGCM